MIGTLLGALVGREIDRSDGDSGIKGALLGAATVGIIRRVGPLALLIGGAWIAKKAYDHSKAEQAVARTPAPIG